ncbi:MAG TPA: hypothetical protein VEK08_17720 [Planctomycetota bacterium]|nr:hypothetical protein [Planctomycetota bacterium]
MTVKQRLRTIVDELPDDCSYDDAMYRLYVMQQIEKGEADVRAGNVIPHDEVMKDIRTWLESSGPRRRKSS